jgi:hypothetical protein
MPHLILNVTGDEFFLPDASQRYLDDLPGEVLQRIVPNTNHAWDGKLEDMLMGLIAWYQTQLYGIAKPRIEWSMSPSGELEVSSDQLPLVAKLWQCVNPTARDFRYEIVGEEAWVSSVINADDDGKYRVSVSPPALGYIAYMVELTFSGVAGIPQVYTTSVYITPDEHPFELEEPLVDPKLASYWRLQTNWAIEGRPLDYTLADLQEMLPIRVLGDYIEDVNKLAVYLQDNVARQACTAARLNVEVDEVGWYSTIFDWGVTKIKYWQSYNLAEQYYSQGNKRLAAAICYWLAHQKETLRIPIATD